MKYRKAQSEIITTVLIILLVLAAIVIVWQVVQGTIKKGATGVEKGASCMGIVLDIVSIKNISGTTSSVSVTRKPGADDTSITGLTFLVDSAVVTATAPTGFTTFNVFDTKIWTVDDDAAGDLGAVDAGKKVEIAPKLADGTSCNVAASLPSTGV